MTLWCAFNGYIGYGEVGALVEADTEAEAYAAASAAFAAYNPDRPDYAEVTEIYPVQLPYVGDGFGEVPLYAEDAAIDGGDET